MTGRARRIDAGQEEQLDHHEAFALAGLAAALGDVEGEASGVVVTGARRLGRREELANVIEQARVGREVGARRASDRLLVDAHQPLDALHPARRSGRRRVVTTVRSSSSPSSSSDGRAMAELFRDQFHQDLAHQARLARAGNAGHGREHAQRKGDVELVQVVASDAAQPQPALGRARCSA